MSNYHEFKIPILFEAPILPNLRLTFIQRVFQQPLLMSLVCILSSIFPAFFSNETELFKVYKISTYSVYLVIFLYFLLFWKIFTNFVYPQCLKRLKVSVAGTRFGVLLGRVTTMKRLMGKFSGLAADVLIVVLTILLGVEEKHMVGWIMQTSMVMFAWSLTCFFTCSDMNVILFLVGLQCFTAFKVELEGNKKKGILRAGSCIFSILVISVRHFVQAQDAQQQKDFQRYREDSSRYQLSLTSDNLLHMKILNINLLFITEFDKARAVVLTQQCQSEKAAMQAQHSSYTATLQARHNSEVAGLQEQIYRLMADKEDFRLMIHNLEDELAMAKIAKVTAEQMKIDQEPLRRGLSFRK